MSTDASTLPPELEMAFEPLHKRAFGMALGITTGLLFFAATVVVLLRPGVEAPDLRILDEYFYGYTVSWAGAFIALAWGFVAGFAAGWFAAFVRNFVMAAELWLGRNRTELEATRDFLDHI
jgi:hypothetical protein